MFCIKRIRGVVVACFATAMTAGHAFTNNILLTGYWPPTNEMVRQFSNNPAQNPGGWRGENWEGRGFNVYSYFPEFPTGTFPVGVGDFTVDYQDTDADFWRITDMVKPVAIMTFSRGATGQLWEVERIQRNLTTWVNDYVAPLQPTPAPPDPTLIANGIRYSSLPMAEIVSNVNAAGLGLSAFVDQNGAGGGFLSEYMAYHGVWYRDMHISPDDPNQCFMSGHIHVGTNVSVATGITATEISLRTTINTLQGMVPEPATIAAMTLGVSLLLLRRRRIL